MIAFTHLSRLGSCLVVRKDEPKGGANNEFAKFMNKQAAKKYVKAWKRKEWQDARCLEKDLPDATAEMTHKYCEERVDYGPCICMVAKAHSCHVGCSKKLVEKEVQIEACPAACRSGNFPGGQCSVGDPLNGGVKLSEGFTGTCQSFCSPLFGDFRFCGEGGAYEKEGHIDCTRCDPSKDQAGEKVWVTKGFTTNSQVSWTECMADCFPNPTCTEMCAEGSEDCRPNCIRNYEAVVIPFKHMFEQSKTQVPLEEVVKFLH